MCSIMERVIEHNVKATQKQTVVQKARCWNYKLYSLILRYKAKWMIGN